MSGLEIAASMIAVFFLGIIIRIPVPFALLAGSLFVLLIDDGITPFLIIDRTFKAYDSFLLLAVPFFLLAANVMNVGGLTSRLIALSQAVVGRLPGGLAQVNVFVSMLFAGVSGSSSADAAGIGKVMIPNMKQQGYSASFSVAVTACSSVMGVIFPPSILMIIWGGTMNVSIASLFLAGVLPGLLIGLSMMLTVYLYAKKYRYPVADSFSFRRIFNRLRSAIWGLLMPLIVIGGIIGGITTPTEAAIIATLYTIFISLFIYKSVSLKQIYATLSESAYFSGMMLFNIGAASAFSWILAYYQVPQELVASIAGLDLSRIEIIVIITLSFLVVGLFMDNIPAIIILGTILQPLALSAGIHPVQFAIIGVIALAYGLVTPPYGICLLITSRIGEISVLKAMRDVLIFLAPMLLILLLVMFSEDLVLWLPRLIVPEFL